jgi:cardiolipin synthase
MNWVLILGGVIIFIIIWLMLDFRLGQKRHLSVASQKESGILHSHFDIFMHGKELFHDYLEEIRKAKHHVHVLFYIVKDDRFSQEFLGLLMNKAREGVEVRLLLDRLGSWKINRKIVKELEAAGVQFSFSDKVQFPFVFYSSQVRNHRKITVIDGKIGYLGGFNIGKEYIDKEPKLSPWRDYHLKITGEGVSYLQSEFFSDWRRSENGGLQGTGAAAGAEIGPDGGVSEAGAQSGLVGEAGRTALQNGFTNAMGGESDTTDSVLGASAQNGNSGAADRTVFHHSSSGADPDASPYFPKLEKGDIRHQFVPTEAGQLEERFMMLLQKAEQKIIIGSPYFIPSRRLFAELMAAVQRGVKITLIVPYTADHLLVQEASYRFLRRLIRAGAAVNQYKNGFYHAKTLIIDDKICDVGTANFDKRSLYLNKEMNCYLYDPNFIARVKEVLHKDLLDSEPLTLKALTKFNPFRTLKEIIGGALSYFL